MKKIKILFILFFVLFLSGCAGSYNIRINEDLSVTEDINIRLDDATNYDKANKLLNNLGFKQDDYSVMEDGNQLKISFKKEYSSIESYISESMMYKYLFENIDYYSDKNSIEIYANGSLKLDSSYSDNSNIINDLDIDLLNINISSPFSIIDSNYDSINDGIMTWEIKRNTKSKVISFKLGTEVSNMKSIIIAISLVVVVLVTAGYIVFRFFKNRK